ncbi:MAG: lactate racemase domain-containing protein, partial [Defluviitaleaceae bacterium]|nr:lactate racemase domain-containing protein [Defluviitaleaceae bacterium]
MNPISLTSNTGITNAALADALRQSLMGRKLKKILLIPPDATRSHSYAGEITQLYFDMLKDTCHIDILPALGTHEPMSERECSSFLGVPFASVIPHNWRGDVVKLGEVPGSFVADISEGLMTEPIDVEINKRLLDKSYDLIISIGQVVPHEVAGMANYSKNIFVGVGGSGMINSSHMLGAFYGIERVLGRTDTPVRKVFDYAEEHYIQNLPLLYVLTVTTQVDGDTVLNGLFIGRGRGLFENAARLSQQKNLTLLDAPLKKAVVYLDELEFKSFWLGNKAIYRTRMAMADGGELIILAPGVKRFGEDEAVDALIRKYGYAGRKRILELVAENEDLRNNLSAAAHLIHGSSDGRFNITYAVENLTRQEVESVGFKYMPLSDALTAYDPSTLTDG